MNQEIRNYPAKQQAIEQELSDLLAIALLQKATEPQLTDIELDFTKRMSKSIKHAE